MNQRWLARRGSHLTAKTARRRNRKNKYGRQDGHNRCGHDPRAYRWPKCEKSLPPILHKAMQANREIALPLGLDFRFGGRERRSERDECTRAVVDVMLQRTDVLSQRVGRPGRRKRFDGLTIDYDLAPLSGHGESQVERALATLKDIGWIEYRDVEPGRRKAKRGKLRCSSQPIEERPGGERRGRAAIRRWTAKFWRDHRLDLALAAAQQKAYEEQHGQAPEGVPLAPVFDELGAALWDPTSKPRPPP